MFRRNMLSPSSVSKGLVSTSKTNGCDDQEDHNLDNRKEKVIWIL
jgi:hypothetical protein